MAKAKSSEVDAFLVSCRTKKTKWDTFTPEQQQFLRDVHASMKDGTSGVSFRALSRGIAKKFNTTIGRSCIETVWAMLDGESK